jgi:hypothetical protein
MTSGGGRYRSKAIAQQVIGFSISFQRDALLARGFGVDHLRELLLRLARILLRQSAYLAYGGHWKEAEDNFTYDLLRLISAEQEDSSADDADSNVTIGRLYNHSAWPYYLEVTPQIEAQWINCCRVVRITQAAAGLQPAEIVPDGDAKSKSPRIAFNTACCLSTMRRLMNETMTVQFPDVPSETIPPVIARVFLGGKTTGFSGFAPGIFEEALVGLEASRPTYLLGGFGGATEVVAQGILSAAEKPPSELTVEWHEKLQPTFAELLKSLNDFRLPPLVREPAKVFDQLWQRLVAARGSIATALNTGLSDEETRELMTTNDMQAAIRLVRNGLSQKCNLTPLPA